MNLRQEELLSQLLQIDEYEFEQLVADIWEQRGWETTVTAGSGDRGIDVIAQKSGPFSTKYLIQAKKYSTGNKIGAPDVQQYSSLKHQERNVDGVVIVTTSSFTSPAKQTAEDLNVKLIDGDDLYGMIDVLDSKEFLNKYIHITKTPDVQHTTGSSADSDETPARIESQSVESEKDNRTSKSEQKDNPVTFSSCPICTSRGQVGFREGHCTSCDSDWTKHSGFLRTNWEVDGGPENGEVKTGSEWQEYLYSSETAQQNNQISEDTSILALFAGPALVLIFLASTVLSVILGFFSLLTGSIHHLLLPTVGVLLLLILTILVIGWWQSVSSQESEEKSEKEETRPRGVE